MRAVLIDLDEPILRERTPEEKRRWESFMAEVRRMPKWDERQYWRIFNRLFPETL